MAKDIVYYYDKITFKEYELGEIQTNFNMSFVIDGTKDSSKIEVINFDSNRVEPNTIIQHKNTQTWWIVSNDKVERFENEDGFIYKHNLQIEGAIELLNARDLTDIGYYQNRYTIREFINRLFVNSTFEFSNQKQNVLSFQIVNTNAINLERKIDYIKTFENYTLLSALREFFDGYNCTCKLTFEVQEVGTSNYLRVAKLNIVSKVGNSDQQVYSESEFNEVGGITTVDKNSFGTVVISNAENVISTKTKTFPTNGSVKLSSTTATITPSNAVLRLPSNAFYVNYVDMICPREVSFNWVGRQATFSIKFECYNESVIKSQILAKVETWEYEVQNVYYDVPQEIKDKVINNIDIIAHCVALSMASRFWNCDNYNPDTKLFVPDREINDFYFPYIVCRDSNGVDKYVGNVALTNKEMYDTRTYNEQAFYWERGSNIIGGLNFLGTNNIENSYLYSYGYTNIRKQIFFEFEDIRVSGIVSPSGLISPNLLPRNVSFVVNYIPMSDIKVKYDNSGLSNDTKLYNQNGKLTDSSALSKILLSYSKEIESDTIMRSGIYYDYDLVPKVGSVVNMTNGQYIINNVSINFYQNENETYYLECEFTMSKNVATKSLMVNPNTNIRDYGIPQNNNITRKQLYRDFYEFDYTYDSGSDSDYYLEFDKVLNLTNFYKPYQEHMAIIKLEFKEPYGEENEESDTWYYQLETTTYMLKKAIYEVVDFKDNNIIGYGSQNVFTKFDITKVISGNIETINTPISYVDDNGEFVSCEIAFCTGSQINDIYDNYLHTVNNGQYHDTQFALYNYSCFIPQEIFNGDFETTYVKRQFPLEFMISESGSVDNPLQLDVTDMLEEIGYSGDGSDILPYGVVFTPVPSTNPFTIVSQSISLINDKYILSISWTHTGLLNGYIYSAQGFEMNGYYGAKDLNDFMISEPNYEKDALEVPFFEYCCQFDDSDNVVFGENILDTKDSDICYIYPAIITQSGSANQNNGDMFFNEEEITILPNEISEEIDLENLYSNGYELDNVVAKFEIVGTQVHISFYESITISSNKEITYGNQVALSNLIVANKDIVIGRFVVNSNDKIEEEETQYTPKCDLMLILRNTQSATTSDNKIIIETNHYKIR